MANYHLAELEIARDPTHPRHILPPPLPQSFRVLDVGCGAGQSLMSAYPDRLSFGIDKDFRALTLGKSMSDRICFVNAAAEALPFRSQEFDFVYARVSLPYTNIFRSLAEIHRVLKKDETIWLTLHGFDTVWKQRAKRSRTWFAYVMINSLCSRFFHRQFSIRGGYESFQTETSIRQALTRTGFEDIQITRGKHFLVTSRAA
jgi:ubiquinone/menaquinone biosynthesis C-methylase UbiE